MSETSRCFSAEPWFADTLIGLSDHPDGFLAGFCMTVPKGAKAFCVKGSVDMRALSALICVTMIRSDLRVTVTASTAHRIEKVVAMLLRSQEITVT